jgi:crossover junction endonuclease EME1
MLIEPDKHAMVTMTATQFVDLVLAAAPQQQPPSEPTETLDAHISRMKRHFPDHTLIYLLEGLNVWMRKNRTVRDRYFQAAVRSVLPPPADDNTVSGTAARRRKQPAKQVYVDEDLIEDALLALQVRHKVLVHHTAIPLETARQIAIFTQHLSTLPYRRIKDKLNAASAGFCMDAGQVRPGDGPRDTFVRMLQEITRVTAPIAYGILGEFGSVTKLVSGMEEGGPLRLEDVRKCADREGTVAERRVGPAVSKRVWKVFTGQNEESNDV